MKKNLSILFSIIILSAAIGLSVRFVFAQLGWEEPANTPPFDNEIPLWVKNGNNLYHTTGGWTGFLTNDPKGTIHLSGGQTWGTDLNLDSTTLSGGRRWLLVSTGGNAAEGQGKFLIKDNNANAVRLTIDTSGNVSIPGTLTVGSCSGCSSAVTWASITNKPAGFTDDVDNDTTYTAGTNLSLSGTTFNVVNSPSFSGNVGIGTTVPGAKLDILGNFKVLVNKYRYTRGPNLYRPSGTYCPCDTNPNTLNCQPIFYSNIDYGSACYDKNNANNYGYQYNRSDVGASLDVDTSGKVNIGQMLNVSDNVSILGNVSSYSLDVAGAANVGDQLILNNLEYASSGDDIDIVGRLGYGATDRDDAGAIKFGKELNWTTTSSSRDGYMAFNTSVNGSSYERMRITSKGRLGIGTRAPQYLLDVGGSFRALSANILGTANVSSLTATDTVKAGDNAFQIDSAAATPYSKYLDRTYVLEVTPSKVGTVVKIPILVFEKLCASAEGYGCEITLAMKSWDANKPTLMASRGPRHFSYASDKNWWSISDDDIEAKNNNGVMDEWKAWDCYFTDAETSTSASNGRSDSTAGFGLLNVKGGGYSDSITSCVLIIRDTVGKPEKTGYLVNGAHKEADCTAIGGIVVTSGGSKVCRFSDDVCAAGWTQYSSWSTTTAKSCSGGGKSCYGVGCGGQTSCATDEHSWSDATREVCGYRSEKCTLLGCATDLQTCYADITQVGCY